MPDFSDRHTFLKMTYFSQNADFSQIADYRTRVGIIRRDFLRLRRPICGEVLLLRSLRILVCRLCRGLLQRTAAEPQISDEHLRKSVAFPQIGRQSRKIITTLLRNLDSFKEQVRSSPLICCRSLRDVRRRPLKAVECG